MTNYILILLFTFLSFFTSSAYAEEVNLGTWDFGDNVRGVNMLGNASFFFSTSYNSSTNICDYWISDALGGIIQQGSLGSDLNNITPSTCDFLQLMRIENYQDNKIIIFAIDTGREVSGQFRNRLNYVIVKYNTISNSYNIYDNPSLYAGYTHIQEEFQFNYTDSNGVLYFRFPSGSNNRGISLVDGSLTTFTSYTAGNGCNVYTEYNSTYGSAFWDGDYDDLNNNPLSLNGYSFNEFGSGIFNECVNSTGVRDDTSSNEILTNYPTAYRDFYKARVWGPVNGNIWVSSCYENEKNIEVGLDEFNTKNLTLYTEQGATQDYTFISPSFFDYTIDIGGEVEFLRRFDDTHEGLGFNNNDPICNTNYIYEFDGTGLPIGVYYNRDDNYYNFTFDENLRSELLTPGESEFEPLPPDEDDGLSGFFGSIIRFFNFINNGLDALTSAISNLWDFIQSLTQLGQISIIPSTYANNDPLDMIINNTSSQFENDGVFKNVFFDFLKWGLIGVGVVIITLFIFSNYRD